jgi:hypothetical protein
MSCIIRILTGVLQDADNDSYRRVTRVFVFLACAGFVVALILLVASTKNVDLQRLQWSRKKRVANGALINERKLRAETEAYERNKKISIVCFGLTMLLMVGGWTAYFWGVATGNNA